MEVNTYKQLYKPGTKFYYYLSGDIHLDEPGFDKAFFTREYEEAMKRNARIYINGDIFSAILPRDLKRFSNSRSTNNRDAILNDVVDQGVALLAPYANNIDIIGIGNHEVSVLKFHHLDLISLLVRELNKVRDVAKYGYIKHGGYTGWILLHFREQFKKATGGTQSFRIWYNHGQGGSAPVTKGAIGIARRSYINSNIIWLAHSHTSLNIKMDPEIGVTTMGVPYKREKRGVITGGYREAFRKYKIEETGYQIDYGEERMTTPEQVGGAFVTVRPTRLDTPFRVAM